jgi:hypothetical protein
MFGTTAVSRREGTVLHFIKQDNYKDPTEIMDFQTTARKLILVREHTTDHKIVKMPGSITTQPFSKSTSQPKVS